MRKVVISEVVSGKIEELEHFLIDELQLSEPAALKRSGRLRNFVLKLRNDTVDYRLCRFKRWRTLGYRCVQTGGWVFAYETFEDGIIVRDMAHGAALHDGE